MWGGGAHTSAMAFESHGVLSHCLSKVTMRIKKNVFLSSLKFIKPGVIIGVNGNYLLTIMAGEIGGKLLTVYGE